MSSDEAGAAGCERGNRVRDPGASGRIGSWLALLLLALLLVLGGLGSAAWYAWSDLNTPIAQPTAGVIVSVPTGASFRSIADQLCRAGLLRHPRILSAWARYYGLDRRVHSGDYRIETAVSPLQILDILQSPSRALHRVTIPEGLNARQVAVLLERAGFGGRDLFRCAMRDAGLLRELGLPATGMEGYLFPDTYALTWATEPDAILKMMVARFREHSQALAERRVAAGLTEQEMVILASVIEKETGRVDERALISGVFHNRLRLGMPLQSDPTVIYGLDRFRGRLSHRDLINPSRYNTYLHAGLPLGPIANPGLAALEAAITPAPTGALYFVSRNDGSHEFSETLSDHNRAVRRYQRPHTASEAETDVAR
jgi:UPF0755 protein